MKTVDQPMINSFLNELKGASHEQSTGNRITRAQYKVTMSNNGRTRNWTTVWCGWKCVAWQTGTWRSWRSGLGFRIWGDVHIFCLLTVWLMFMFLTYVYLLYFTFVLCSAVFFFLYALQCQCLPIKKSFCKCESCLLQSSSHIYIIWGQMYNTCHHT